MYVIAQRQHVSTNARARLASSSQHLPKILFPYFNLILMSIHIQQFNIYIDRIVEWNTSSLLGAHKLTYKLLILRSRFYIYTSLVKNAPAIWWFIHEHTHTEHLRSDYEIEANFTQKSTVILLQFFMYSTLSPRDINLWKMYYNFYQIYEYKYCNIERAPIRLLKSS